MMNDHPINPDFDDDEVPPVSDRTEPFPEWCSNLRMLVLESGLTQAEIARRAGLQRDAFGRYFSGKTPPPHAKLIAIAQVFGVKPSAIDPERADLDDKQPERRFVQPPYRLTPASSGKPGKVFLEISAEVDIETAADLIRRLSEAGTK